MQLDALQSLALSVAAARSPDSVLTEMVQGLGMWEGVALARVWLLVAGGQEPPYLELKASIGASRSRPRADAGTARTAAHHRIPLSYGKVGQIAATNGPLLFATRAARLDRGTGVGGRGGDRELRGSAALLQGTGPRGRGVLQP